ncbi:cytochrome P450 [Streptomyces sp. CA-135486]|uniref:cytochrome P450 n=1 Tax=Streptomyces sp. CA-135486 TaxID=3240049 RepID=UPI003D8BFB57
MLDRTVPLMMRGYAWLPDRLRRTGGRLVRTRLLGKPAVALHGPEAVRFFYDEAHIRRRSALPEPVISTLFGQGAVHTLDGDRHRERKSMFVSLLKDPAQVSALARGVEAEWDRARRDWARRERVVLFDEVSVVLARAVCGWAGVRLTDDEARETADDLVAMVDGFATLGPRHWRARAARNRQETRLAALVARTREEPAAGGRVLQAVASHREADGALLDPRTAAVELLNIIRPTVAVTWFMTFAAHALHRHPGMRRSLAEGDPEYARAFGQEVRRFYPFVPFLGGLAAKDLRWRDESIPAGVLVLLDVYGHHHDAALWADPYTFDPQRFVGREPGRDELIPQGGGAVDAGHRCPGEDVTLALLSTLIPRLARLRYAVPRQDLRIPLSRVPTRPRSGFVLTDVGTD